MFVMFKKTIYSASVVKDTLKEFKAKGIVSFTIEEKGGKIKVLQCDNNERVLDEFCNYVIFKIGQSK